MFPGFLQQPATAPVALCALGQSQSIDTALRSMERYKRESFFLHFF